jgi:hypothetical protein
MPPEPLRRRRQIAALRSLPGWLALGVAFAVLFVPLPGRFQAPWIGCLLDLGHVPLFAAVAWSVRQATGWRPMAAAAAALGLALAIEPLQTLVSRSASWGDVFRGACGVAIFVGWNFAGRLSPRRRRHAARFACIAGGVAPAIMLQWPLLYDSVEAWREFPVLADFSSPWETSRWAILGPQLSWERDADGKGVGVLRRNATDRPHSAIVLFPIRRDWSAWKTLVVDFTVEAGSLPIMLSVRDGRRVHPPQRRFDFHDVYNIGRHRVSIDLAELAHGSGTVASINVAAVQSFHLVVGGQGAGRVLRLHRVWLE